MWLIEAIPKPLWLVWGSIVTIICVYSCLFAVATAEEANQKGIRLTQREAAKLIVLFLLALFIGATAGTLVCINI